jgi:hypothetical protein
MLIAASNWLTYIVGALTGLNALFNFYLICVHPAFKKGGALHAFSDPFAGMTSGEREVADYLQRNPEVLAKVGTSAARAAASNPELARQVASGAATAAVSSGGSGKPGDNPFA